MRHQVFGRKLKRDNKERKALRRSLISSLILHGRIKTTQAKAKAIKGVVDKLVTSAKEGKKRQLTAFLLNKKIIEKFMIEVNSSFPKRTSGFTRIIKLGRRIGDNAEMVILEWMGREETKETKGTKGRKGKHVDKTNKTE